MVGEDGLSVKVVLVYDAIVLEGFLQNIAKIRALNDNLVYVEFLPSVILDATLVYLDGGALVLGLFGLREGWRGSLNPFGVGLFEVGALEELLDAVGSSNVFKALLLPARASKVLVTGSDTVRFCLGNSVSNTLHNILAATSAWAL